MAGLGGSTSHVTIVEASAATRTRSNSAFVPELWTDEVVATYKSNLVLAPLVVHMDFVGRKGDTVHVPRPVRGSASAKAAETVVTLIANQETQSAFVIDEHWEYSRLIEDIVGVQASDTLRQFYTDDAGYALAKRVDINLHAEGAKFAGADASPTVAGSAYSKAVIGTPSAGALVAYSNTTSGNAASLTDEGIRLLIRKLDDSDVKGQGRVFVIPPGEKKNLLGISRFTEQAFTGEVGMGNSIRNGRIGDLYGVEFYVSTNCANLTASGPTSYGTVGRAALLFQKEALMLIEQMRPRVQTSYIQEYLGDLFTTDMIFDVGLLRPEAGIAVAVPV
jgi:hypothetical protein